MVLRLASPARAILASDSRGTIGVKAEWHEVGRFCRSSKPPFSMLFRPGQDRGVAGTRLLVVGNCDRRIFGGTLRMRCRRVMRPVGQLRS